MTTSSEAAGSTGVSNQLASLVPTFDPAKDDMVAYQQRVELVVAAWPKNKITELITRLILNCQGSAFQKLQLHQAELLTGDSSAVERLIEILGGQWGKIPLATRYEEAEQAIFQCTQKPAESNDSYLARADVMWSKLLARKMTMSQLQAYITLRGSSLSSDDKKKVIMESESSGELTEKKVTESVRLLGASFFHDVTGLKRVSKVKVYDQSALVTESQTDAVEPEYDSTALHAEEITEEEFLEQLAAEGDGDAVLITDFEAAAQDSL